MSGWRNISARAIIGAPSSILLNPLVFVNTSQLSFEPVRDIFRAMQTEQINGVPLSDVIGGGDPERVASEILSVLSRHVDLGAKRSVLDMGCGCGRIAAGLTQFLNETSEYVGVDILPGLIEFGRKFITPRYSRFKFLLLDQGNFTYDTLRPEGSAVDIAELSQVCPAGSVDLAISISLFTHLDYAAAVDVLKNVSWLLASGGQAFITIFVVDGEARRNIESGATGFRFAHRTPSGELSAEKLEDPTFAVGYQVEKMDELVASAGLRRERWIRGYWSQGNSGETFQDALILRKP
jgi:SAM-dependent methyltransferase